MVSVKREGILLKPTNLNFENYAVMNPGCIKVGNDVHMFYRAVRKGNHSTIGYCRLEGPLKVVERWKEPVMTPEFDYEKRGVEDPRIVYLNGVYYMFYVAHDGKNALVAYATGRDLKKWGKKGVITPRITYDEAEDFFPKHKLKDRYFFFESFYKTEHAKDVLLWEKDAFLFPKKFNGKFALVHRILPDIQVIYFRDFKELTDEYWKNYLKHLGDYVVLESKYWYESRHIGGGCPPIETPEGWLLIYHSAEDSNKGRIYHAGAALLDRKNPCKVIGRLKNPLFSPEERWEKRGNVKNVVFPTGAAVFGKRLYIYYGAADTRIAVASLDMNEILEKLLKSRKK